MIDHGDQYVNKVISLYGHSSKLLKNVGDVVKQSDTILEIGSTGIYRWPILKLENGIPTDLKNIYQMIIVKVRRFSERF